MSAHAPAIAKDSSTVPLPTSVAANSQSLTNSRSAGLFLQRKCACGSSTASLTGECGECKSKKLVQTKLTVGASNDPLEHEADRVADQVLAAPANAAVSSAPPRIQRFTGQPSASAGIPAPASVDHVLASPGTPLEPTLRQDMEQRFGHDFSTVRVHSDGIAEQSARDVNASAYTVGHDIVFGASSFTPGTQEGRRLLAHELTHVAQQDGRMSVIQRAPAEDTRWSRNENVARIRGQLMATRIRKHGVLSKEARAKVNHELTYFEGSAREAYVKEVRPILLAVTEIEMSGETEPTVKTAPAGASSVGQPPELEEMKSYVFVGEKRLKTDTAFAQNSGREIAARIRKNGGRPSKADSLEREGMQKFFEGEAKQVYLQQVAAYSVTLDFSLRVLIRETVKELDKDSPSDRVLVSQLIAAVRNDSRQWALELEAIHHHTSGNYLLLFFDELAKRPGIFSQLFGVTSDGHRKLADWFKTKLIEKNVNVAELSLEWELHLQEIDEQSENLKVHLKNYPIYDWKVALGGLLEPFVKVVNLILHFVPVFGQALGAFEALIGREVLTGEKLEGWERMLNLLPYAGTILKAGKNGARVILVIAEQTGLKGESVLGLLRKLDTLSSEADRLQEFKKIVDQGGKLSAEQERSLMAAHDVLRPLEKELQIAGTATQPTGSAVGGSQKEIKTAEKVLEIPGATAGSAAKAKAALAVKLEHLSEPIQLAGKSHALSLRRVGNQLKVWLCSNGCGELIAKLEAMIGRLPGKHEARAELERLLGQVRNEATWIDLYPAGEEAQNELQKLRRVLEDIESRHPRVVNPDIQAAPALPAKTPKSPHKDPSAADFDALEPSGPLKPKKQRPRSAEDLSGKTSMAENFAKRELENSAWLKRRLPDEKHRRLFMEFLEEGHFGEHGHLTPDTNEANRILEHWATGEPKVRLLPSRR